jgi:hypothetical protein
LVQKHKAIILTFAPVTPKERKLLIRTKILKFAINQHAEYLKPDYRICTDYGVIGNLLQNFSQRIITTREWVPNKRLIYAGQINFKGSTIVSCVEYLISVGIKEILIVGDNTVHSEVFKNRINAELLIIRQKNQNVKVYQYRKGNFYLPVKSVKHFIN